MTDRELMQMALDALIETVRLAGEYGTHLIRNDKDAGHAHETIEALRARLAQPDCACDSPAWCEQYGKCHRVVVGVEPAQPEPEPVAWKDAPSKIYLQVCDESDCDQPFDSHIEVSWCQDKINDSDIAYIRADTAPPKREWQGLTDEEIEKLYLGSFDEGQFARAIEAKLKEKNT